MWFLASSAHQSAETTSKAIDNFLLKSRKMIGAMPENDFNSLKKAMKDALKVMPKDLDTENDKLWKEISTFELMFDRPLQYADMLDNITKADFE